MYYLEKLVLIVLCLSTNLLAGHTIGSLNSTDASLAFLVLQLLSHSNVYILEMGNFG